MVYTSEYAQSQLTKSSGNIKKERKHRSKATKATLQGKDKKAARQAAKADKFL